MKNELYLPLEEEVENKVKDNIDEALVVFIHPES